jgi:hypothetical protein
MHNEDLQKWKEYNNVTKALRKQILNAVEADFIVHLEDEYSRYNNMDLNIFWTTYSHHTEKSHPLFSSRTTGHLTKSGILHNLSKLFLHEPKDAVIMQQTVNNCTPQSRSSPNYMPLFSKLAFTTMHLKSGMSCQPIKKPSEPSPNTSSTHKPIYTTKS